MDTRITELLEEIKKAIDKAATTGDKYQFIDPVFDLTDELEQCETPFDAVRPILELIESSPNIDFGGPGPLGSFKRGYFETTLIDRRIRIITSSFEAWYQKQTHYVKISERSNENGIYREA